MKSQIPTLPKRLKYVKFVCVYAGLYVCMHVFGGGVGRIQVLLQLGCLRIKIDFGICTSSKGNALHLTSIPGKQWRTRD